MAHTSGPWYARISSADQGLIASESTGETIAVTYRPNNAQLVAAAPDLLAALRECITDDGALAMQYDRNHPAARRMREINRVAQAAIDKAIGKE